VIGGIAVVAAGRGGGLPDVEPERSPTGALPDGAVDRAGIDGLRFSLALRGYRMDEVDAVLDRLVDELDRRGTRILELESRLDDSPTSTDTRAAQED
jgi:DivIVA domain-containing protein